MGRRRRVLAIHRKVAAAPRPSLAVAVAHLRDAALGLVWNFDGYEVTLISLRQGNSGVVIGEHLQIAGLSISDRRHGGQSAFGSDGLRHRPQEDLHRKHFVIEITLVLYFVGVLFSGIKLALFCLFLPGF
jgi:hypothetical protein